MSRNNCGYVRGSVNCANLHFVVETSRERFRDAVGESKEERVARKRAKKAAAKRAVKKKAVKKAVKRRAVKKAVKKKAVKKAVRRRAVKKVVARRAVKRAVARAIVAALGETPPPPSEGSTG
jgi:hypothetical protein